MTGSNAGARNSESYGDETDDIIPIESFTNQRSPTERLFLIGDVAALIIAFILSGVLSRIIDQSLFGKNLTLLVPYATLREFAIYMTIGLIALVWMDTKGHYVQRLPRWETMSHVVSVTTVGLFVNGFIHFIVRNDTSRLWLAGSWLIFGALMFVNRKLIKRWLTTHGKWTISALLIGDGPTLNNIVDALHAEVEMGYNVIDIMPSSALDSLTSPQAWEELMRVTGANHILLAMPDHKIGHYQSELKSLVYARLPYSLVPAASSLPSSTLSSHYLFTHGVTILHHTNRLQLILPRLIKRSFDIFMSASALLVLSPVLLVLTVVVKRDGGPALFGHKRIGQHGRRFACLKFRSMVINGDEVLRRHLAANPAAMAEWKAEWKLREDPRVTKLGHFLRKSSLDELPQLFNVLKGDMSLVGPRPIIMAECAEYDSDIALYHMVRPGLTGLWQISGRNEVSYRERVEMDSRYVRNWSFWHDIAIILKTFPVLLNRTGAF
jgi:undecaprenyl-phosphate galactose phosphotransferase